MEYVPIDPRLSIHPKGEGAYDNVNKFPELVIEKTAFGILLIVSSTASADTSSRFHLNYLAEL